MRRFFSCWVLLLASLAAVDLRADELVVLRSGAELVGDVSFDGDDVIVHIGEAALRMPQANVARIGANARTGSGGADADRAQEMLISWLEDQAAKRGDAVAEPGLLAEASRLAPDDPRIAYWYATSLVGDGQGRAAQKVLEAHRSAIDKRYPALAADLWRRIADRCEIEERPKPFVERYDRLNAQLAGGAELPSDEALTAAAFRLVDQNGDAVPEESITLSNSDCRLETFAEGWRLCTYMTRKSSRREAVELRITDPAYGTQEFEVRGGLNRVRDLGELRVDRRSDKDLVTTTFKVLAPTGNPIGGARVFVRPSQSNGLENTKTQLETTSDGTAEAKLFPGAYVVNFYRDGFVPDLQTFRIGPGAASPIEARLQPSINGAVRVAWRIVDPGAQQADGGASGDESQVMNLPFINGQLAQVGFPSTWLNVRQTKENLFFFVVDQRLMYRPPAMQPIARDESWTRIANKKFDEIDLADLTAPKEAGEKPQPIGVEPGRTYPPNLSVEPLVLRPGAVYFGQTSIMAPSPGPPSVKTLRYKLVFDAVGGEKQVKPQGEKADRRDEESPED